MWKLAITTTTTARRTGGGIGEIVALMPRVTITPLFFSRRLASTSRTPTTTTITSSASIGSTTTYRNSATAGTSHINNSKSSSSRMGHRTSPRRNSREQTVKVTAQSSKAAASGPTMSRSRFYRIIMEYGFGFAMYLYILGESITLTVVYILHSNIFSTGDSFSWMRSIGCDRLVDLDRWSHAGPVISGVCFSPRLLLNYLIANIITYPLYSLQVAFCVRTFPLLRLLLSPVNYIFLRLQRCGKNNTARIPKAPSAKVKPAGSLTQ
ncbi:uncharacterized protein TM35_000281380 [Trypanosoma theileri]|uniref:Uncharacterized protein n=1 Tax=Trypanosoma theileri TaxID=67003 RepID=A0A1X0NNX7_9TRYP|nr:uncharacterized protein TM35_000281380 [Trypanosoma theileri]ORC86422.1 hypothetical protein TM35_000281380 [Trypanosoma theileri]